MISFARVAMVGIALLMAGTVQAQTTPAASGSGGRVYAEVAAGSTFGHVSARSVGGEAGVRLTDAVEVFVEGGRMDNVATADLDARAQIIATFIRGSSSVVQKSTYVDAGVKYRFPPMGGMVRPYIGVGIGSAKVTRQVSFAVNGTDVTSQLLDRFGIQLGNDLTDAVDKRFVMVTFGAQALFAKHFVVDGSYRYGRILPKACSRNTCSEGEIDGDVGINAQRVQIGVGVRF